MPVNRYDGGKVSLWRPHGNGDLDIVRASYTRRKANVTEALMLLTCDVNAGFTLATLAARLTSLVYVGES